MLLYKKIVAHDFRYDPRMSLLQPVQACIMGFDSSVGIATRYGLEGPGIEFRWGARFSVPVQTGPRIHPAFCTTDSGSLSRG